MHFTCSKIKQKNIIFKLLVYTAHSILLLMKICMLSLKVCFLSKGKSTNYKQVTQLIQTVIVPLLQFSQSSASRISSRLLALFQLQLQINFALYNCKTETEQQIANSTRIDNYHNTTKVS